MPRPSWLAAAPMQDLFARLPEGLFSPLSGANRRIYGRLLLDLHPLFFEQAHPDTFPTRETVRAEIGELLARLAVSELAGDEEGDDGPEGPVPEGEVSARVYRRLRAAGWLEEEPDGYKVRVSVPPAVATLWTALMEIARPEQVFYGGMVLSILNNVQRAVEDPRGQALAFRQAASEARRFRQHLNAMIYGLKGLLGTLAEVADPRQVLGHFFDDFVERFLVGDYKKLKTRNNPFRFRYDILMRVRELEFDPARRRLLVEGYLEQTGLADSESAWEALQRDIATLRGVFDQVDDHLARVDRYRGRVERRVADTVRYLDRTQPGLAPRLAGLLARIGRAWAAAPDEGEAPRLLPLLDALPVSRFSLQAPRAARRAHEPRPLQRRAVDGAVLARQRALRAYTERRRIDPRRIESYLEAQLATRASVASEELPVTSVEDFIAFTHLRHLTLLPGAERLRRRYRVERLPGEMENEWLRCPRFLVRRQEAGDGHAA